LSFFFAEGINSNNVAYEKDFYISTRFKAFWIQSKTICQSYGMEFVSLDSKLEEDSLLSFSRQKISLLDDQNHIGALTNVGASKTEWYWVATEAKLNFALNFRGGEPNNSFNDEYCLAISKLGSEALINDVPCNSYSAKFMCQVKR
jgi:Lectin C-type domain